MPQDISALETEVAEEVDVMAGVDPAKLAKLQSDLDTSGTSLAAAVAANTPAAPPEG